MGTMIASSVIIQAGAAGAAISTSAGVAALIAYPISLGAPFFVSKIDSDASIRKENFESKKFRATTLEYNEKKDGFLYFNWNELKNLNEVSICFILKDSISEFANYPCYKISLKNR